MRDLVPLSSAILFVILCKYSHKLTLYEDIFHLCLNHEQGRNLNNWKEF